MGMPLAFGHIAFNYQVPILIPQLDERIPNFRDYTIFSCRYLKVLYLVCLCIMKDQKNLISMATKMGHVPNVIGTYNSVSNPITLYDNNLPSCTRTS